MKLNTIEGYDLVAYYRAVKAAEEPAPPVEGVGRDYADQKIDNYLTEEHLRVFAGLRNAFAIMILLAFAFWVACRVL